MADERIDGPGRSHPAAHRRNAGGGRFVLGRYRQPVPTQPAGRLPASEGAARGQIGERADPGAKTNLCPEPGRHRRVVRLAGANPRLLESEIGCPRSRLKKGSAMSKGEVIAESAVKFVRDLPASPGRLWEFLTDMDLLPEWYGETQIEEREG